MCKGIRGLKTTEWRMESREVGFWTVPAITQSTTRTATELTRCSLCAGIVLTFFSWNENTLG